MGLTPRIGNKREKENTEIKVFIRERFKLLCKKNYSITSKNVGIKHLRNKGLRIYFVSSVLAFVIHSLEFLCFGDCCFPSVRWRKQGCVSHLDRDKVSDSKKCTCGTHQEPEILAKIRQESGAPRTLQTSGQGMDFLTRFGKD